MRLWALVSFCLLAQVPTLEVRARSAARWFVAAFQTEREEEAAKAERPAAIAYFRRLAPAELKKQLEPVLAKYSVKTVEGAGAAYVLAMRGVEVSRQVDRLAATHPKGTWATDVAYGVQASLPEGLAQIAARHKSQPALDLLYRLTGEGEHFFFLMDAHLMVLELNPEFVLSEMLRRRNGLEELAEPIAAAIDASEPSERARPRMKAALSKARKTPRLRSAADRLEARVERILRENQG